MRRKANILVVSHQYIDDDVQRAETRAEGELREENGVLSVVYPDDLGDGMKTECRVEYDGKSLRIVRSGSVTAALEIIEGVKNECDYMTSFGAFRVGVTGKKTEVKKRDGRTELTAYYYLSFGSAESVLNKVKIIAWYGDIINE